MPEDKNVLCNLCGLTCNLPVGPADSGETDAHGLVEQVVYGHYASTPGNGHGALDDMTAYKFSLCEFCLDWLFSRFKAPPRVFERDLNCNLLDEGSWRPARQRVAEDDWRRFKQETLDEMARRDEARKA